MKSLRENLKIIATGHILVSGMDALLSSIKIVRNIYKRKNISKLKLRNTKYSFASPEKVLFFVCRGYNLKVNSGVTNWITGLVEGFARQGEYRVVILCENSLFRHSYYKEANIEILSLPTLRYIKRQDFSYDLSWFHTLGSFIKKHGLDSANAYFVGPLAGIEMLFSTELKIAKTITLLMTPRGLDRNLNEEVMNRREAIYKDYEARICFNISTSLVSDSHSLIKDLGKYFDKSLPSVTKVIPIGHYDDDCNLIANNKKILCFGPLRWRKGSDLLPEIILNTLKELSGWDFIIATSGGEMTEIREILEKFEKQKLITLEINPDEDTKHKLMQRSDILLLPSRYESFGMVASEALCHGMKVVCAEVGGLPEVVDLDGQFVEEFSAKGFSDAIVTCANDVDFYLSNKLQRSIRARKKFSTVDMIEKFNIFLE